jgi:hypothetical protein
MRLKTTFFTLLLLPVFGYSQNVSCSKFREGTFRLTDPTTKKVCIITRKNDIQTEKMEDAAEIYDFTIKWLDDCTYTINPTPATAARKQDILKAGTMTVKIIKVTDSSYTQRVKVASNPKFRRIDEVYLVPEKDK